MIDGEPCWGGSRGVQAVTIFCPPSEISKKCKTRRSLLGVNQRSEMRNDVCNKHAEETKLEKGTGGPVTNLLRKY